MMTRALNNVRDLNATAAMQIRSACRRPTRSPVALVQAAPLRPHRLLLRRHLPEHHRLVCVDRCARAHATTACAILRRPRHLLRRRPHRHLRRHVHARQHRLACSTGFSSAEAAVPADEQGAAADGDGHHLTMMLATVVTALMDARHFNLLFCFLQWCALVWYIASYIVRPEDHLECLGKAANSAANSVVIRGRLSLTCACVCV